VNPAQCLVVAKAPVPGLAKTRLGSVIGMAAAAEVAAAALLDTLAASEDAFGHRRCHMALTGDLTRAVRGPEITERLRGWSVFDQVGDSFAERLVAAHGAVGRRTGAPTVQIGMDTPQVTSSQLRQVAATLDDHAAVLGPAPDGGWWVLALRHPEDARVLAAVPTSTPETASRTRDALRHRGLAVGTTVGLRDVDTVEDARAVAREIPHSRFAAAWALADVTRVGVAAP
jgi:glycosyltransferase A (GT-A) superfamily protein (DUF2064 family)